MKRILIDLITRYSNAENLSIRTVEVKDQLMSQFLKSSYEIVEKLDREMADEGRRTLYTLVRRMTSSVHPRFNDHKFCEIVLSEFEVLKRILSGFTLDPMLIEGMRGTLEKLLSRGTNYKFTFIESDIAKQNAETGLAIVYRGSRWRTFDIDAAPELRALGNLLTYETKEFKCFDRVYCPIPLGKIKRNIATEFILKGGTSQIVSVLYHSEFNYAYQIPDFVSTDAGSIPKLIHLRKIPKETFEIEVSSPLEDTFFESDYEPPYDRSFGMLNLLMESGATVVIPIDDEVWAIRESSNSPHFSQLWPDLLEEGDHLIFVPESYVHSRDKILRLTQVWRGPLNMLLLSMSYKEFSGQIHKLCGLSPSSGSIKSWAEGGVYGPETQNVFFALIDMLVDENALNRLEAHNEKMNWWHFLESSRRAQVSLGVEIRRTLIQDIKNALSDGNIESVLGIRVERILAIQSSEFNGHKESGKLTGSNLRVMQ